MEKSLQYAIAKAKRNIENGTYSKSEMILDAIYQYNIRKDEVGDMMKSVNKWIEKNIWLYDLYTEQEIEAIKRDM